MTTEHWLLVIRQAPPPSQHAPGTMLLTAGDKLLFERVDGEWIIRVEHLNPDAPEAVRRLRAASKPTKPPATPNTARGNRWSSTLPSIPEYDDPPAQSSTGASSSHPGPHSYYPPIRKPDTKPDTSPEAGTSQPASNQPAAAATALNQPHARLLWMIDSSVAAKPTRRAHPAHPHSPT